VRTPNEAAAPQTSPPTEVTTSVKLKPPRLKLVGSLKAGNAEKPPEDPAKLAETYLLHVGAFLERRAEAAVADRAAADAPSTSNAVNIPGGMTFALLRELEQLKEETLKAFSSPSVVGCIPVADFTRLLQTLTALVVAPIGRQLVKDNDGEDASDVSAVCCALEAATTAMHLARVPGMPYQGA
jgi:hypothetical protein